MGCRSGNNLVRGIRLMNNGGSHGTPFGDRLEIFQSRKKNMLTV